MLINFYLDNFDSIDFQATNFFLTSPHFVSYLVESNTYHVYVSKIQSANPSEFRNEVDVSINLDNFEEIISYVGAGVFSTFINSYNFLVKLCSKLIDNSVLWYTVKRTIIHIRQYLRICFNTMNYVPFQIEIFQDKEEGRFEEKLNQMDLSLRSGFPHFGFLNALYFNDRFIQATLSYFIRKGNSISSKSFSILLDFVEGVISKCEFGGFTLVFGIQVGSRNKGRCIYQEERHTFIKFLVDQILENTAISIEEISIFFSNILTDKKRSFYVFRLLLVPLFELMETRVVEFEEKREFYRLCNFVLELSYRLLDQIYTNVNQFLISQYALIGVMQLLDENVIKDQKICIKFLKVIQEMIPSSKNLNSLKVKMVYRRFSKYMIESGIADFVYLILKRHWKRKPLIYSLAANYFTSVSQISNSYLICYMVRLLSDTSNPSG